MSTGWRVWAAAPSVLKLCCAKIAVLKVVLLARWPGAFLHYSIFRRDPENKNHLVPDEYAAQVVRDIYHRRIDGASAERIAAELNRLGVLSPLAYKISRGLPHPSGGYAPGGDSVYLFSGLLVCGSCGGRMTRKVNTYKKKKYVYYRCPIGRSRTTAIEVTR